MMNTHLNKSSVITILARKKVIERLLRKYSLSSPYAKDLCQDLYIELLNKEDSLIVGLYERNEIEFYIRKMISNNVNSSTSPFYKNYEKFRKTTNDIDEQKDKI